MCYQSHKCVYRAPICIELRGFGATRGPAQTFRDLVTSWRGRIKAQTALQKHICCGAWEFRSHPEQLVRALRMVTILPASVFMFFIVSLQALKLSRLRALHVYSRNSCPYTAFVNFRGDSTSPCMQGSTIVLYRDL